ncbi:hypothetical protein IQ07DRAFT_645459 [Pyrenochaeta sp. DS3sAY3a]|nr:hypothetical protein IQ07DRAFT_645459 [Pyrenochaeta sp. DS3sAY3a]
MSSASNSTFDFDSNDKPPIPPRNPLRLGGPKKPENEVANPSSRPSQDILDELDRELEDTRGQLASVMHDDNDNDRDSGRDGGSNAEAGVEKRAQEMEYPAPLSPASTSAPGSRVREEAWRKRECKRDTAIVAAMDYIEEALKREQELANPMYSITDEAQKPVSEATQKVKGVRGNRDVGNSSEQPVLKDNEIESTLPNTPNIPTPTPLPTERPQPLRRPRPTSSLYSTDDLSEDARFEAWLARGIPSPTSSSSTKNKQPSRSSRKGSTSTGVASQRGGRPAAVEYGVLSPYERERGRVGDVRGTGTGRGEDMPEPLFARGAADGVRTVGGGRVAQAQAKPQPQLQSQYQGQGQSQNKGADSAQPPRTFSPDAPSKQAAGWPLSDVEAYDTVVVSPRAGGIVELEPPPPPPARGSPYNPDWNESDSFWKQHHNQHEPPSGNPPGSSRSNPLNPGSPQPQHTVRAIGPSTTGVHHGNRYDKALHAPPPGWTAPDPPRPQGNNFHPPPPVHSYQYPQDDANAPETSDAEFFHAEIYASPAQSTLHVSRSHHNDRNIREWLHNAQTRYSDMHAESIAPSESASQIYVRKAPRASSASAQRKIMSPIRETGNAGSSQGGRAMHYQIPPGTESDGMQKWAGKHVAVAGQVDEDLTALGSARHVAGKVARFVLGAPSDPRLKTHSRRLVQGSEDGFDTCLPGQSGLHGIAGESSEDQKNDKKKRSKWTLKGKGKGDTTPEPSTTPFNIKDIKIVHTHNPTLPNSTSVVNTPRVSRSLFKRSADQEPSPVPLRASSRPYSPSHLGTECTAWPEGDFEGNMVIPRRRYEGEALRSRFSADSSQLGVESDHRGSAEEDYAKFMQLAG